MERTPSPQHRNAGCAGGLSRSAKVNTLRPSWESGAKWNDAVSGVKGGGRGGGRHHAAGQRLLADRVILEGDPHLDDLTVVG